MNICKSRNIQNIYSLDMHAQRLKTQIRHFHHDYLYHLLVELNLTTFLLSLINEINLIFKFDDEYIFFQLFFLLLLFF